MEKNHSEHSEKLGGKFLTFFLGKEEYGLPILTVQEIIALLPITPVPRTPNYFKGLTNLRGKIIPVMDLRLKFGMEELEPTDETCIIVVRTSKQLMGLIVDRVSEVKNISDESIDEPPEFGDNSITDYLSAIGKSNESVVLIVDIEKVVNTNELSEINFNEVENSSANSEENIS
ncbi:MAG: chemotaxis protein CheW [Candidatus Schekmanbacteria bacterium]|nr:MAG: chemotaxis protein CheW [Candidatus Schekmanbacteria bacterium]